MERGDAVYKLNKSEDNLVVCPEMPTVNYAGGKLFWTEKSGMTYKLWTGREYVDVSGGSYTVDTGVYGCYSLMAVSADGVCSELSKPIVISPDRIRVQAESGSVSSSSLISSGYVIDNRSRSANLTLSVTIDKKGKYLLSGIYNNPGDATSGVSCAVRSVYVDGVDMGSLVFPEVYSEHKNQTGTHLSLDLDEGVHTVKIFYDTANWYDRNMSITKNNVEYDYFNFDYVGSAGQQPAGILGDANGDEDVDSVDATIIQRVCTMIKVPFSEEQLMCGDVDRDGSLTTVDATFIQRYSTHISTPYNIGEPIA